MLDPIKRIGPIAEAPKIDPIPPSNIKSPVESDLEAEERDEEKVYEHAFGEGETDGEHREFEKEDG